MNPLDEETPSIIDDAGRIVTDKDECIRGLSQTIMALVGILQITNELLKLLVKDHVAQEHDGDGSSCRMQRIVDGNDATLAKLTQQRPEYPH